MSVIAPASAGGRSAALHLAGALAWGLSCSPANSLQGSMADLSPLAFTDVSVRLQGPVVSVEYDYRADGGASVPFQLSVNASGVAFDAGFTLELAGTITDGGLKIADAGRSRDAGGSDGGRGDAGPGGQSDGGADAGPVYLAVAGRAFSGDLHPFSAIAFGHLTVDGPLAVGAAASGDFFVVFAYQNDGSIGSGRTVYGNFSAKVSP